MHAKCDEKKKVFLQIQFPTSNFQKKNLNFIELNIDKQIQINQSASK